MPSRKRKYPINRVRKDYTYSVEEIAELFNLAPPTIFRWIGGEGLERIPNSKKYFVHSSQLIAFLEKKNGKNKRPCYDDEIYCCKCRKPQQPNLQTLKTKNIPNGTIRVFGQCATCGTSINKVVSGQKWHKNHPLYPNINADPRQHSGAIPAQRKCEDRKGEQLCLNITL